MRRQLTVLIFFVSVVLWAQNLQVDRDELQAAQAQSVEFENYEGVPEKVETLAQIRGIGTALAGQGIRSTTGRYTVIRAVDPAETQGLDADIFILEADATVDHIRNLRWIVGSYLEAQYGYQRADADLLARFITIYNAVYRKNLPYFQERFKKVVLSYLSENKVGLARSYKEWAGNTQMVIPLSGPRKKGILSVETSALTEKPVIQELKKEEDRGIPLRKEMVDLKERQLKEEERQIAEEKKALQAEKEKLAAEEAAKQASATATQPQPSGVAQKEAEPKREEQKAKVEDKVAAVDKPVEGQAPPQETPKEAPAEKQEASAAAKAEQAATFPAQEEQKEEKAPVPSTAKETLEAKEKELAEREQKLKEKQEEVRQERAEIAKDQQQILETKAQSVAPGVPFVFRDPSGPRLVILEAETGSIRVQSPESPLRQSQFFSFGGGFLVVLPRDKDGGRLGLLDPYNLQLKVSSREEVFGASKIQVQGTHCFAVIQEGTDWFVGKFDAALSLVERSRVSVVPETDLVISGSKLYVQTKEGKIGVLTVEELKEP